MKRSICLVSSCFIVSKLQDNFTSFGVSGFSTNRNQCIQHDKHRKHCKQSRLEAKSEKSQDDVNIMMDDISDEEALLACRAYLQRKNRLGKDGWTKYKERQEKLKSALAMGSHIDENFSQDASEEDHAKAQPAVDPGAGYFWENPEELKYLRTGRPRLSFDDQDDSLDEDFLYNMDEEEENQYDEDDDEFLLEEEYDEDGIFTGFPSKPPEEYILRSNNKKELFQDADWKKMWYTRRWGNHASKRQREQRNKEKKLQKYVQQIPNSILKNQELAVLTDEEIEYAIKIYVIANKRRSIAQKKRLKEKKAAMKIQSNKKKKSKMKSSSVKAVSGPTLDSFLSQMNGDSRVAEELREQQKRRSERSKKAYQTRIKHVNKSTNVDSSRNKATSKTMNQSEQLDEDELMFMNDKISMSSERIRQIINDPSLLDKKLLDLDLKVIMHPGRLKGRKQMLKGLLETCFGLKGKCIPKHGNLSDDELNEFYSKYNDVDSLEKKFVTQSSVYELARIIEFKNQDY
ncbi:hypothetical protein CTEN210_14583 [Chaetoceros tenuissimus]|uniref:Uncharacterized protein n=1 Tax=Chaetoceros tenuissimus TaxID=426638 RepID=A0AAD3D560_9STRA|nr:hypothetical protein CTEN210_14583 [Chaetoceros tenuissimus]